MNPPPAAPTTTSSNGSLSEGMSDTPAQPRQIDPRLKQADLPAIQGPRPTPEQLVKVYKAYHEVAAMGPIGHRLSIATRHSMRAFYEAPLDDHEYVMPGVFRPGKLDVKARIIWDAEESMLILAFKGLTQEWDVIEDSIACVRPSWIDRSMAGDACVHYYFANAFLSLLKPQDPDQPGLLDTINHILGGTVAEHVM